MIRFTNGEINALLSYGYYVVQNDDEESYATCAQATTGSPHWIKKTEDSEDCGGWSSYHEHYFLRVVKGPKHFTWFGAPRLVGLNPQSAEFLGVFDRLNVDVLIALLDVIWEMEKNPLPERSDFQIQRFPTFEVHN